MMKHTTMPELPAHSSPNILTTCEPQADTDRMPFFSCPPEKPEDTQDCTDTVPLFAPIRTFVQRKGRMTEAQQKAYKAFFPRWCIPYKPALLSFVEIFGNTHPVIIEIGFGMGIATAKIAAQNPEINYLGIEVYQAGVGKLLSEIERLQLKNIRIIEHDALEVLTTMIADSSIAGFHVFFPDPWQKKKHHKRRLMRRPRTELLTQKLQDTGYIYMVTDWYDYAVDAFTELSATKGLCSKYDGFAPPQTWRPQTKFEQKGLNKSHPISELVFIRS